MVPIERYIAASKGTRASPLSLISAVVRVKRTPPCYIIDDLPHLGELFIHYCYWGCGLMFNTDDWNKQPFLSFFVVLK